MDTKSSNDKSESLQKVPCIFFISLYGYRPWYQERTILNSVDNALGIQKYVEIR